MPTDRGPSSFARHTGDAASTDDLRTDASARGTSLADLLARELLITPEEAADLIDFGSIQVDGKGETNPSRLLAGGEAIRVHWPRNGTRRHYELDPARVIYRDRVLLAYDKEAGVPSQQTPADGYNNLYAAVLRNLRASAPRGRTPYAALHHRLDRETSGVMVFALDRAVNARIGEAFESRRVEKQYLAWLGGTPKEDAWEIDEEIGREKSRYCAVKRGRGKPAKTLFRVLFRGPDRALVLARPLTGRTHQIRIHAECSGAPILGDRAHGGRPAERLFLHAFRLTLPHPATGNALVLTAPVPDDWPEPRPTDVTADAL